MSSWADIRRAARENVHNTFGLSAQYFSSSDATGTGAPVSVRIHNKLLRIGDLDREGYSQTIEEVEKVIFRSSDVTANTIKRNGSILLSDGRKYRLELRNPARDDFSIEFEVTRVTP